MPHRRPAPPRTRPRPRGEATRAAILEAAERLFAQSGLAGARTDAIAAAAGVNKALLYYYFQSKEQLYAAVIDHHFGEFNRQALETLAAPGSARSVLLGYVSLHFDFISARHRHAALYHQLLLAGGKVSERLVCQYFTPRSDAFVRLLRRGIRSGEFRRVDPFHAAVSIASLVVFYFAAAHVPRWLERPQAYSPANVRRRKREVLDFIRCGLFSDPHSASS